MKTSVRLFIAIPAVAALLSAADTNIWSQSDYSEFTKGSLKKLSLSSDGRITLAPLSHEILDSASVYLWALAEDSKGNVYAGGGGPGGPGARIYQIPPDGKGKTLAEFDDLEVHAIAVDKSDRVYAATAPDGKVYRVTQAGKPEVFFDPKAKYIWAMAFDSKGNLFVATGDRGEIYRVAPDGKGSVFYKTAETHARSLAIDSKDNLIAGTEPDGLIIRIGPDGKGFVLYQAPKREITAVAVAANGTIYAAGVGNRSTTGSAPALGLPPSMPPAPQAMTTAPGAQVQPRPITTSPSSIVGAPPSIPGGSEVYRIDPDGFPHRVWSHLQNVAYAIAFDANGKPLIGTGNKGIVYRLDSDRVYTELLNVPPTQVTCIYAGRGAKLYAATGNVGKVYQVGPALEKEGTIESDVFDAELFSRWGRLSFRGQTNEGRIAIETRSGNMDRPEKDWSEWSAAIASPDGAPVASPPARFVQWRARLSASAAGSSPALQSVDVAYKGRNVPPELQEVDITPANYRFPTPSTLTSTNPPSITLPAIGRAPRQSAPSLSSGSGSVSMNHASGYIGARWAASDENDDSLIYKVEIRGEKETEWKPLKDKVAEKYVSWDSTAFPDGEYRVRVTASDEPSNPQEQALSVELVSEPFLIDNTPPAISGLAASVQAGKLKVAFKATDARGLIGKAEVSVNGGEWAVVDPVTGLSDSREEDYEVLLPAPAGREQTVAVRVADEYDNQSVAKVIVR
jgi:sugar lactone lactonase YvrE